MNTDVKTLFGFNPTNGLDTLIASYGGDLLNVVTGAGYGQNILSGTNAEMTTFLGKAWFTNGVDGNRNFDGTTWVTTGPTTVHPKARFIHNYKTRIFLSYITILGVDYPSRVWYSDLPVNNTVTWGFETQTNLQQTAGSNVVTSPGAKFITQNIKVGDAFVITTGLNAGQYIVSSIISESQLTLTKNLTYSAPASTYWVGGNFFDVQTDDNDTLTGFGDNSDQLLLFKKDSLWRYNLKTLQRVKGVPGTTSGRSIVNNNQYTFYFHSTGLWRYDGSTSDLVSRKVKDYLSGVASSQYNQVVGWIVGEDIYRCFVGTISNTTVDPQISVSNGFIDYDTATLALSIGSYPFKVVDATTFRESQAVNTYLGTNDGRVFQDQVGNSDNSAAIPFGAETNWIFPFGEGISGKISRIQVFVKTGRAISVKYKRYGIPTTIDKQWKPLGSIKDYVTEFKVDEFMSEPMRGLKLLFIESSTRQSLAIEKILIFVIPETARVAQQES